MTHEMLPIIYSSMLFVNLPSAYFQAPTWYGDTLSKSSGLMLGQMPRGGYDLSIVVKR